MLIYIKMRRISLKNILKRTSRIILFGAFIFLTSCSSIKNHHTSRDLSESIKKSHIQIGTASWYGSKFHGKKTASGKVFDKRKMTAAHRTLPFGARIKVTNLRNGRSIILVVNDRGPFVRKDKKRILDVSESAALALGFKRDGLTNIKLEYLS